MRQGGQMKFRALLVVASVFAVGAMGTGVAGASKASTEYFTIVQTSFDGPQTVYAVGPISGTGTDTVMGPHKDVFGFTDGSVTIKHSRTGNAKNTYDPATCVGTFTEKGTYTIPNGTGAYAGVSGSGRYQVSGFFQGCDHHQPPTVALVIIRASGPISL
jgi:hypothetical protein